MTLIFETLVGFCVICFLVVRFFFIGMKILIVSCVKDRNEKPTERYERGLAMDSLTIFNLNDSF